MTKSRKVLLTFALVVIGAVPVVLTATAANNYLWCALFILYAVVYLYLLYFVPSLEDGRIYKTISLCTCAIFILFTVTFALAVPRLIYISIFISLYLPIFTMLMRGKIKYISVVLLMCASAPLYILALTLTLFLSARWPAELSGAVYYIIIAVQVFLVFRLFFHIRKMRFTYTFLLLLTLSSSVLILSMLHASTIT